MGNRLHIEINKVESHYFENGKLVLYDTPIGKSSFSMITRRIASLFLKNFLIKSPVCLKPDFINISSIFS